MSPNDSYPTRDFSDQELEISSWLLRNRVLFKKLLYGFLIGLDSIFVILFAWQLVKYAREYADTERALYGSAIMEIDWPSVRKAIAPDPINVSFVEFIDTGNATDFVARVINSNKDRHGMFDYRFVWAGGETDWFTTFIMPEQTKYISALGVDTRSPGTVQLETQNLRWSKLSTEDRDLLDITRDGLVILTTVFTPNINEGFTGAPVSSADFVVENRTPFDLQNVGFTVVVQSGSTIIGMNRVVVPRIDKNEKRPVSVRWFNYIGGGQVVVEPDINYLDSASFAPRLPDEEVLDETP